MVAHIVIWNFQDEVSDKDQAFNEMKEVLEALVGKIEGLVHLEFRRNYNPQGQDLCLYSKLDSPEALEAYQVHPDHVAAAGVVKKYVQDRRVVDYLI